MEIEFVTEPSVYVTGVMQPQFHEIDRFFADRGQEGKEIPRSPSPEVNVVLGSRTCYESYDRGRQHGDHCEHLVSSGHGSCLEHAVFQVMLTGISRDCGRQLLRHRHLSPSESSQRYVDKSKARIVVPPLELDVYREWSRYPSGGANKHEVGEETWKKICEFDEFYHLCKVSLLTYRDRMAGVKSKKQKEAARSRLLGSVETTITFTGNVRCFRNVFERRCSEAADAEVRRVCCILFDKMKVYVPNLLSDYTKRELGDGTFELGTLYRGC